MTVVPSVGQEGALPSEPGLIRPEANATVGDAKAQSEQPNSCGRAEIAETLGGSSESEAALGPVQALGHVMPQPSDSLSPCPPSGSVVIQIEGLGAPEQDGGGLCKLLLRPGTKNPSERAEAT